MNIQKISIDQINPAAYNPRKDLAPGDGEYEKLKRSIEEFGCVEPIVWNKRTGNIVGGNQRYKVLTALGYTDIDCVVVDLDDQREKTLNIALNKISGSWDTEMLSSLLDEINADLLGLTGFDAEEIESLAIVPGAINLNDESTGGERGGQICHCPKCGFAFEVPK